jgi:hypothetical protein
VDLRRQQSWITSGIVDDRRFAAGDGEALDAVELRKLVRDEPGRETYTVALASDGDLPADRGAVEMTADVELRRWSELWYEQRRQLEARDTSDAEREAQLASLHSELGELRRQLVAGEMELGRLPELESRVVELSDLLAELEHLRELRRTYEKVVASKSWRITRPLRALAEMIRERRG